MTSWPLSLATACATLGSFGGHTLAIRWLLPFADLPIVASLAMLCLSSTERSLGVAAGVFGDDALAVRHLERAVVANRSLGTCRRWR